MKGLTPVTWRSNQINTDMHGKLSFVRHSDFDPVREPLKTLINMSSLLETKGMYPCDIIDRSHLAHNLAETAIIHLCYNHYLSYNVLPEMKISPSIYNPEEVDTRRAIFLASDKNSISYIQKVEQLKDERKLLLKDRFLKATPEKIFCLSEQDKAYIENVTQEDVIESFRTEFRLTRQGAARSQTAPSRTSSDGGLEATFIYDLNENEQVCWGRTSPDYSQSAKLYDIQLPDGTKVTVFLEISSLKSGLKAISVKNSNEIPDCQLSEFISTIQTEPERPGHTILHAFNTRYMDITLQAETIAKTGIGCVLTSPPLTWRADGPSTPQEERNQWYHAYQPEDIRSIDNPHGNLQDYKEMIDVLKGYGIGVIADIPLNFMGKGGDGGSDNGGTGTLRYPSTDIRNTRAEFIKTGTGRVEGQMLLKKLKYEDKEIKQYPDRSYTDQADFEASTVNVVDWNDLNDIRHNRLGGMPKISSDSEWILNVQREWVKALGNLGVAGFRIDAEKHLTPEQRDSVLSSEIIKDKFVFGENIVANTADPVWTDYLGPRLQERPDIGAYDFLLQAKLVQAFKYGGDLQQLKMEEKGTVTPVPASQSITFTVNHDIPNNGDIFSHLLLADSVDEMLANVYILSIPNRTPLIFSDGKCHKSVTEISCGENRQLGGQAWSTGWKKMSSMIAFHNKYHDKTGIWFASEGYLATECCLAFSRGDGPVNSDEDNSSHSGVVIINKAAEPISDITWPNPLKPGIYRDYGPANKGTFIVNEQGRFASPLTVGGRTALMLALDEE
ncbi:hypothetical protein F9222_24300 [Escherichia coli]|nr:hypothetical protein F9222_24300 [Escherichia coli]